MARWFAEHRKESSFGELELITRKHFPEEADRREFTAFLDSPEGQRRFKKQLRFEAWRTHLGGEEDVYPKPTAPKAGDFWLGIAGAEKKFPLGQIVMTRGVSDMVAENTEFSRCAAQSLRRHASGDWGDLSGEDKRENEYALGKHLRLFSAYEKPPLPKIWIITEADRSVTTILFPEEY